MSAEPYYLAHTARCKLKMAADRPDRNLRFILGHAFTLDKIMLRVMEIESESSSDESFTDDGDKHVSFRNNAKPHSSNARNRSPPPAQVTPTCGVDEDLSDEEYEDEEEEENGLSLRRYESGTVRPPRMIGDDGSSSDEDEPISPPLIPSELELESITAGVENGELTDMYQHVKGCPCNGQHEHAPMVTKAWDVPEKIAGDGKRYAVVQIAS